MRKDSEGRSRRTRSLYKLSCQKLTAFFALSLIWLFLLWIFFLGFQKSCSVGVLLTVFCTIPKQASSSDFIPGNLAVHTFTFCWGFIAAIPPPPTPTVFFTHSQNLTHGKHSYIICSTNSAGQSCHNWGFPQLYSACLSSPRLIHCLLPDSQLHSMKDMY